MATQTKPRAKPKARYFKGVGAQVVKFAESRILQTKGRWAGVPIKMEQWQRELIDEMYLVDADGKRVYREALVGVARKNGKSTLSAAIALHALMAAGESGPEVYAAAASRDQARIVFQQAVEFIEASPKLREWLRPSRNVITCQANNGVFRVLSSDAPTQHGLNPSAVVIDELHAHRDPELYYALTTGSIARQEPLVVSITTAGYDRSTICWDVYQRGEALAAKGVDAMREARFLHYWKAPPLNASHNSRRAWKVANPSSWVTSSVLEHEHSRLPESVFRRLHMNQWVESEDFWISPEEWDACTGKPRINPDEDVWMGIDIGIKRDATAIAWVQWHDDVLHARVDIRIPSNLQPVAAIDSRHRVKRLAAKFPSLREVAFDPWQFTESAEMLSEEGLPMVEIPQNNARMSQASEQFYELIREGRLVHDGDEELRRQVLGAVAAESDRGWRISKRKSNARIDATVALAMAVERAVSSRLDKPFRLGDFRIETL